MNERLIHLRIKIKSLAAEATIIRNESHKAKGMTKWGLNHHRTAVVRRHSRHNLLAYGFLKGLSYEAMERNCADSPDFKMVLEIVKRFHDGAPIDGELIMWIEKAKAYIKERSK
jgi:hypothetical protein